MRTLLDKKAKIATPCIMGSIINIQSMEGFGGKAVIIDSRDDCWSNYKVRMIDGSQPDFWAHNFEIEEYSTMKDNKKILFADIPIQDIRPLGIFADLFRYEVRDNEVPNCVYFAEDVIACEPQFFIKHFTEKLLQKELFLVKIQLGVVVFIDDFSNPETIKIEDLKPILNETYVLFVEKKSSLEESDIPF